jgi:hypothetical protein
MEFLTHKVNDEAAIENGTWQDIQKEAAKHIRSKITVEDWSEFKEISYQQIRWWKGILLPALSKSNGDTENEWETRLKLAVMPDEFKPEKETIDGAEYTFIPSITILSMKKLNQLMESSVSMLHNWDFTWVTLPDSALRKNKIKETSNAR